jgi:ribose/xylose/arabinose/galactoside ABC-type transport system permease subunit
MALKSLRNEATPPLPATAPLSTSDGAAMKRHRLTVQREVIVLLAMLAFNLLFTPHFWSLQTFNVNMTQVVTIVIVGIGMTLVVAVGGTALTGGKAYIGGTLIGALIIQLLRYTLLAHGIPDAAALVVKAGIIIAAVYVQRRSR